MRKVELGCGATKEEGYLGVDRFALPGVDVVADLNGRFPFEEDSIDEIWACHSLEHLDSIAHTFSEIYRVSKHGAIVRILAPYYFSTLNMSNYYHKSVWTEDTPRLFDIYPTNMVDEADWVMPHALSWGVGCSDNSGFKDVIQILYEEFFYFPEYCHLSLEIKRQARRSMINVCDQVYYLLVVNKSGEAFPEEALKEYLQIAKSREPSIIGLLRERDKKCAEAVSGSLFDSISRNTQSIQQIEKASASSKRDFERLEHAVKSIESASVLNKREIDRLEQVVDQSVVEQTSIIESYNQKTQNDLAEFKKTLSSSITERMMLLNSEMSDVSTYIKSFNSAFLDDLLLNPNYQKVCGLLLSEMLSLDKYLEYKVPIGFSELTIGVCSLDCAEIFIELVGNGEIISQSIVTVDGMQLVSINNHRLTDDMYIRFRLNTGDIKLVKLLVVKDKKNTKLAYSVKY